MKPLTVTIDGPAGVGKSTVAKSLATHMQIPYLNSGALYRAVAWCVLESNLNTSDEDAIIALCTRTQFVLSGRVDDPSVVVGGGNQLTHQLWTSSASVVSSQISRFPRVRALLRPIQRRCANDKGVVAEGRDMGTHVFPDAEIKIFLDASPIIRAQRRFRELEGCDIAVSWDTAVNELIERDSRDITRTAAPLQPAPDAIIIDTSDLSASQVVDAILAHIHQRRAQLQTDRMLPADVATQTPASY